jgi:hypothetical protein
LLDTDVLLDVGLRRPRFFGPSSAVLEWAEAQPGQAAVAWHSLANVSYLLRPDARAFIRDLLEFVEVSPTGTEAARQAAALPMSDFEDALQAAAAVAFGASYVVTRNVRHYRRSPVPAIAPGEFASALRRQT